MNKLEIFRTLQRTLENVNMVFYFRNNLYLVNEIGVESTDTAFVSGISARGETIFIKADQLLECQFHIMTVTGNGSELETNFIGINLGQTFLA